jgi:hypothetical protein
MKKDQSNIFVTETDITNAIETKFGFPYYISFPQFRNNTGYNSSRIADCLSLALYDSKEFVIQGFEVKVSRQDWLNELKYPDKSESIMKYCDHWWIVAPPHIVQTEEIPEAWGCYEYKAKRLYLRKAAPELKPVPLSRGFMASLLQRAAKLDHSMSLVPIEKFNKMCDERFKAGKKSVENDAKSAETDLKVLKEKVAAFEKASGIDISSSSDLKDLGSLVKLVQSTEEKDIIGDYDWLVRSLDNMVGDIKTLLKKADEKVKTVNSKYEGKK